MKLNLMIGINKMSCLNCMIFINPTNFKAQVSESSQGSQTMQNNLSSLQQVVIFNPQIPKLSAIYQKMFRALPKIENRYNQSSLSKLSSQLSTLAITRNQSNGKPNKKYKDEFKKHKTQPRVQSILDEYKGQLKSMKKRLAQKNLQKSLMIENKIRRISRLSTDEVARSMQTPRSTINYISLPPAIPPMQQPPILMVNPHVPPYMPAYHSQMHHPYRNEYQDFSPDRQQRRGRKRRRIRNDDDDQSIVHYQKNYDEYDQPTRYKNMSEKNKKRPNLLLHKKKLQKLIKKWKAVVLAVYFSLSLLSYGKKIAELRLMIFQKFEKKRFNIEMTMMQKYIVKKCKPFFVYLANQKTTDLTMQSDQTDRMDNQKAQIAKKLMNILIDGIKEIQLEDTNEPATNPVEIIHMFCKHGSFATKMMTQEQLDMVTFSQKNKYLRFDRNMEISQIINFICNKILLYNTILHPQKVDAQLFPPTDETINKNFYFLGSIWYQICLQVQDQYLCQVPADYQMGNWRKLRERYNIQPAKSLTVNGEPRQEDEMISGLLGKKKIEQIFGKSFWRKEKNNLRNALQHVHKVIKDFHTGLKSKVKF